MRVTDEGVVMLMPGEQVIVRLELADSAISVTAPPEEDAFVIGPSGPMRSFRYKSLGGQVKFQERPIG